MEETGKEAVTSLGHKLLITRRNPEIAELDALPLIPNGKPPASRSTPDSSTSNLADKTDQADRSFGAEYDDTDAYEETRSIAKQTVESTGQDAELPDDLVVKSDPSDDGMEEQGFDRNGRDDQLEYATVSAIVPRDGDQLSATDKKPLSQTAFDRRVTEQGSTNKAEPTVLAETVAVTEKSKSSVAVTTPTLGSSKEVVAAQARDLQNALGMDPNRAERKGARPEVTMEGKPSASAMLDAAAATVPKPDVKGQVVRSGIAAVPNAAEAAVVINMGKEDVRIVRQRPPADEMPALQRNAVKQVKLASAPAITDTTSGPSNANAMQSIDAEPALTSLFEAETAPLRDSRPAAGAPSLTPSQAVLRPETPGMIGRQMAEALQRLPDRPVEITLNPSELGRVRMNISAAEAGIVVSLVVERPETTDLMRRHIDDLAAEFADLGYENIEFSFSDQHDTSDENEGRRNEPVVAISHSDLQDTETSVPPAATLVTGLDLRL